MDLDKLDSISKDIYNILSLNDYAFTGEELADYTNLDGARSIQKHILKMREQGIMITASKDGYTITKSLSEYIKYLEGSYRDKAISILVTKKKLLITAINENRDQQQLPLPDDKEDLKAVLRALNEVESKEEYCGQKS